jgi:hypothetical protein
MDHGGFGVARESGTGTPPVWQGLTKDITLAQGGFTLDVSNLVAGQVVPEGTPIKYNEADRTATVLNTAVMQANAGGSATAYRVNKGHGIQVGNYIATGATGGKAYAVTAIDTSNAAYDELTVGTSIGAATAGDLVFVSTATGATASALPAINGRTYGEVKVPAYGKCTVGVGIRGVVYARRCPNSDAIEADLKANGALIIHSQSF